MNRLFWGIVILVLVWIIGNNVQASARELAIISSRDYPANSISAARVKEIYLGEKLSEGSIKIRPMEQSNDTIKRKFIEKVVGSTVDGYKSYWIKKFFQEGVTPPASKASSAEVIQAVSQTSGGIGYVWAEEVKGDVKVLLKIEVGD